MAKAAKLGSIYVEIAAKLDRLERDMKKAQGISKRSATMIQQGFDKLNFRKARSNLMSFNRFLLMIAGGYGFKQLASSMINTASSFEQMEVKLDLLTKGRGKEAFATINKWALELPITTKEAINSFVMMRAMGLDPTIQRMKTLVDVGTVLGEDTLKRVSLQLGQTAAMGKLMGQEIRVLGEAGIDARRYLREAFGMSVEEVQKSGMNIQRVLAAIFDGMQRDFGGAAEKMKKSWSGLRAIFSSYFTEIQRRIMEAGVFDKLKSHLDEINRKMKNWMNTNEDLIKQDVPKYINKIEKSITNIISLSNELPKGTGAAATYGLIGGILFGPQAGAFFAALTLANEQLKKFYSEADRRTAMALQGTKEGSFFVGKPAGVETLKTLTEEIPPTKPTLHEEIMLGLKKPPSVAIWEDLKEQAFRADDALKEYFRDLDLLKEELAPKPGAISPFADTMFSDLKEFFQIQEDNHKKLISDWNDYEDALKEAAAAQEEFNQVLLEETELERTLREGTFEQRRDTDIALQKYFKSIDEQEKKQRHQSEYFIQLSERTASAMQQNFSNLFYDAMTMKMTSFKDYMLGIFDSILRAWSDMLGQMVTEWMFGDLSKSGVGGGWFNAFIGAFGSASGGTGTAGGTGGGAGYISMARGGIIDKPTIFPFASGVALTGESGPEAILPLKRTSGGDLGIKSEGVGSNFNITINAIDAKSFSELTERNPQAIIAPFIGEITKGDRSLINTIKMIK